MTTRKGTWRLNIAFLFLCASVYAGAAGVAAGVRVFRYDGTLQCGMGEEIPLDAMAKELADAGIKVFKSEKQTVPLMILPVCGAPTGAANVYEIAEADLPRIPKEADGTTRFALWFWDYEQIAVFKYDGTLQCGMGREVTLAEMRKELEQGGTKPVSERKGTDGMSHIQMCGASTGNINIFVIKADDFPRALALKFVFLETVSGGSSPMKVRKSGGDGRPWPW